MSLRDPDDNVYLHSHVSKSDSYDNIYLHSHVSKSDSADALDMCPSPQKTKQQCDISDISLSDSDEEYHMYSYDGKFHSVDDWPGPIETKVHQDDDGTLEATTTTEKEQTSALPFPNMLTKWYKHQYTLATKNIQREKVRLGRKPKSNDGGELVYMNRSKVKGTLQENLLRLKLQDCPHNKAFCRVGEYILHCGSVAKTHEAGEIYAKGKGLTKRRSTVELYDVFSRYLNVSQIYIFGVAYFVYNFPDSNFQSMVHTLKEAINEEHIQMAVEHHLGDYYLCTCNSIYGHA